MSINTYQLLRNVGLTNSRAIQMLPGIKSQSFEVDQVICAKGDNHQSFTYILEGLVCASNPCSDGGLNPVNIFGSGTWFGEAGFINRQSSAFDYQCLAPTCLLSIPLGDALAAFEQEAEFSRYIARLANWRYQQHAEMLTLMRVGSPALRVVMGLSMLTESLQNNASHLPINQFDERLEIRLKQSLLASMCGVSRGIFSVCLQQLATAGWLRVNYATLEMKSIKTWRIFSSSQRENPKRFAKPSMQEILALMQMALVNSNSVAEVQV